MKKMCFLISLILLMFSFSSVGQHLFKDNFSFKSEITRKDVINEKETILVRCKLTNHSNTKQEFMSGPCSLSGYCTIDNKDFTIETESCDQKLPLVSSIDTNESITITLRIYSVKYKKEKDQVFRIGFEILPNLLAREPVKGIAKGEILWSEFITINSSVQSFLSKPK